ncbi:MAG: hypothetical protein IJ087_09940 [Eggerthellaceae bacterium]|nr:hypothetical protein [Eggerthellaceae bacterium]
MSESECLFTGCECDGGRTHADGATGCAYKETPDSECAWLADVPDGTSPRDFYNEKIMEALR